MKKKKEFTYVTMGLDVSIIHVCELIQELSFDFLEKTCFHTTFRTTSCEILGGIICIKIPNTSRNCSQ